MANDIITNLHPDNDPNTNLYPNIKKENIPNKSITTNKLDDDVLSLIGSLKPSGTDTSANILAFTSNKGIYVATDNGHWYYWNGSAYADGGVYQALEIADDSITIDKLSNTITSNIIVNDSINSFIKDNLYGYDYNFKNGVTYEIDIVFNSTLTGSIKGVNASTSDKNNIIIQSIIGSNNANVYLSKDSELSLFL